MRFDWYQASLDYPHNEVIEQVADAFRAGVDHDWPKHGYHHAVRVEDRDSQVRARVMWGGNQGVHVWTSGEDSPLLAGTLREHFPEHRPTRLDAAEDYRAADAWERLYGLLLGVVLRYNLRGYHAGDWTHLTGGRTYYGGSRTSIAQAIVYEKGKQLGTDPEHVRLELRVKPKNVKARERLSQASPHEIFGASRWSIDLAERMGAENLERIAAGTIWDPSADEQAWEWLCHQYGNLLSRKAAALGDWCSVGQALQETISRQKGPSH